MFGQSSSADIFENGEIIKNIKSVASNEEGQKVEMEYSILSQECDATIIKSGNSIFSLNYSQFQVLKEYYDFLNKEFINERIDFKIKIQEQVSQLLEIEEINFMIDNYFADIPSNYFIDYKLIAGIEYKLVQKSKIGKLLLLTNAALRQAMVSVREEKKNGSTSIYETLENNDKVEAYLINYFEMLVKIMKNKFNNDNYTTALFLTYHLLVKEAISYYSKVWKEQYGNYFENIEVLNLKDVMRIYCDIDSINPQNLITAGHFIYYLMDNKKFDNQNDNYITCYDILVDLIEQEMDNKKLSNFEKKLSSKKTEVKYSIDDIDLMGGHEFEAFVALMFSKMGYSTTVTKGSGDQGIDVIAEKNGKKIGIQAKCYSSAVTNSAIQEVVAGVNHYNLDKAIVVTNNYFTKSAQKLAESNNVILWDRNMLKEKMIDVFS